MSATVLSALSALEARRGQDYFTEFVALMNALNDDNDSVLAQALGATTSTSSHSVSTGSKVFVLATDRPYGVGSYVLIARTSDPTTWLHGQVTAKAGTSLTVSIAATNGSGGPYTDWTLGVSGPQGAMGPAASAATESAAGIAEIATQSEVDTGTDDSRFVTALKLATRLGSFLLKAGGRLTGVLLPPTTVTLTDGATITPDFSAGHDFTVTLGGNRTIANPTNISAGQSGSIVIKQDGTGSRTAAFGSYFKFPNGTAPTLTTTASATDRLDYWCESTTVIHANLTKKVS